MKQETPPTKLDSADDCIVGGRSVDTSLVGGVWQDASSWLVTPWQKSLETTDDAETVTTVSKTSSVTSLSDQDSNNVDDTTRRRNTLTTRSKTSRALLHLRAATALNRTLYEPETMERQRQLCRLVGSVGATLFAPLESLDPTCFHGTSTHKPTHTQTNEPSFPQESFPQSEEPVEILPECPSDLTCCPRILTDSMLQQLVHEAIPASLRMNKWKRIFCIGRDGDSFITMLERCSNYKHTLLVIRTTTHHILGGFNSQGWQVQEGQRHSYYGHGQSFLFASHPALCDHHQKLHVFGWTGDNDYCQICDLDQNKIAMGGKGGFGLIVEDNFWKGATNRCATYGNPPLIPDRDGTFEIESLEIYGVEPLIPRTTFNLSQSGFGSMRI